MATLIITPATGSAVTFLAMTADACRTAGKYWRKRPRVVTPQNPVEYIPAPSTAGVAVKRQQFKGREIDNIEVLYVDTSESVVLAAIETDIAAVTNQANVLTVPDYPSTFPACECVEFEAVQDKYGRTVKPTGESSMYRATCTLRFFQARLT